MKSENRKDKFVESSDVARVCCYLIVVVFYYIIYLGIMMHTYHEFHNSWGLMVNLVIGVVILLFPALSLLFRWIRHKIRRPRFNDYQELLKHISLIILFVTVLSEVISVIIITAVDRCVPLEFYNSWWSLIVPISAATVGFFLSFFLSVLFVRILLKKRSSSGHSSKKVLNL